MNGLWIFWIQPMKQGNCSGTMEKGNISAIQENFYMWYISGHTRDYNLLYEDDLKTLTDDERDELADEVIELYNEAVES